MTRRILLSEESKKYLPLAEQRLRELSLLRKSGKLPFMQKPLFINGVYALLTSSDAFDRIVMWGGESLFPHILFLSFLNKNTQAYNYYQKEISFAQGIDLTEGESQESSLWPLYNGRNQLEDIEAYIFDGSAWTTKTLNSPLSYLGHLDSYEMGLFYKDNVIHGRIRDKSGSLFTMPNTFLPQFSGAYADKFAVGAWSVVPEAVWTQYHPINIYSLTPDTYQNEWHWTPSFFVVPPADEITGMQPGFYYGGGVLSGSEYLDGEGNPQPLDSAKVSFCGFMDTRYYGIDGQSQWRYGYAEVVREIDNVVKNDVFVYLSDNSLNTASDNNGTYLRTANVISRPVPTPSKVIAPGEPIKSPLTCAISTGPFSQYPMFFSPIMGGHTSSMKWLEKQVSTLVVNMASTPLSQVIFIMTGEELPRLL